MNQGDSPRAQACRELARTAINRYECGSDGMPGKNFKFSISNDNWEMKDVTVKHFSV